jgi:hypothetical protein
MNVVLRTIIVIAIGILVSCERNEINVNDEFLVIVEEEKDIACGLPVLKFLDRAENVKEKTSYETLTYIAHQLDSSFNKKGTELIIKFNRTIPEDLVPCNALGIWYPGITVLEARLSN